MISVNKLIQVCEEIGIDIQTVKQAESLYRFELSENVLTRDIKQLSAATLVSLSESFNNGLTLRIDDGRDNPPLLKIDIGQLIEEEIRTALDNINRYDDNLKLRITLSINKTSLISQLHFDKDNLNYILYLFKDNLLAFLGSPLPELDKHLFTNRYQPSIIIVVSDDDVYYEGSLLTITSLINADQRMKTISKINAHLRDRIDRYRAIASNNLSWSGFRFEHLTPVHFLCQRKAGIATNIDVIIADHLIHLCVLFTANRSSIEDDHFQATFASSDNTSVLKLTTEHGTNIDPRLLSRVAIWPISGKETDRLTIFQTIVARESESDNPEKNYTNFVLHLQHLLNESRWHHRVFLNGEINKHFGQIETVTNYVYGVTNEVSKAIDSVTKSFVDTLLATVGVIVLTLLASLVKNETQGVIFRIGMQSYAVYLLLFQGFYRLGSICHSYVLLQQETGRRIDTYTRKLGRKKIETLISPLSRRKEQFQIWFWVTVALYVMVIIAVFILSYELPQYLQQIGIVNPTPVPTPLPTVTPVPTPLPTVTPIPTLLPTVTPTS